MERPTRKEQMSAKSADSGGRRHSISCDPRDRSLLHSASETRLPLRILARYSIVPNNPPTSHAPTASAPAAPSIDVKFIQMYVKKLGHGFRQNSDPTFNRRTHPHKSSDTTATNSGQSSSLASSNDDVPTTSDHGPRSIDQAKSIVIVPFEKRAARCAEKFSLVRKSASGSDLRDTTRKKCEELPPSPDNFSNTMTCYRILESLFASGMDAASNSALLCRLKIDHIVDLRSRSPGHSSPISKTSKLTLSAKNSLESSLRCVCADSRHKRHLVNLSINQNANLIDGFKRLNAFITKARVRGEKTLLFDEDGRGMAPATVIEYLMYYYHMRYSAAKIFVSEIISDIQIRENLEKVLLLWQDELEIPATGDQRSPTACSYHQTPDVTNIDSPPNNNKKHMAWI